MAKLAIIYGMKTINISITSEQYSEIEKFTNELGFANRSEFMRSLLRLFIKKPEVLSVETELMPFKKRPLSEIEKRLRKTGRYNEKFIQSVMDGLRRSSIYAASKT